MILFFTQSILGGFLLVGFLGYDREPYWRFYNTLKLFFIPLVCLIINSSFTILMVKRKLIKHYGKFKYIAMVICLIVFIAYIKLDRNWRDKNIPYIEFPIIYGLYYFEQLNNKLLLDPQDL
jgi:amino acid permease